MELATGQGAHGRRHLPRRPPRARPREDARGDARRARDVLRDRRPARARGGRAAPRGGAGARLVRERAVHRGAPARDQSAHLHDRLPGRSQPAVPGRPACASASSTRSSSARISRACARRGARCATTTRSSTTSRDDGGAPSARLRTLASQSAIYGIGPVVARFAGLLLLPIYARHLGPGRGRRTSARSSRSSRSARRSRNSASSTRSSASPPSARATRASRSRARRSRCARAAGIAAGADRGRLATPFAAPVFLGDGNEALWLVACGGLLVSLLYEPCAGLYRVEQRPQRFLAVTLVNVVVTVVVSVVWIIHFDGGALGPDGRLLHGHAGRAAASSCGIAGTRSSGRSTARSPGRCCASACRSCPRASRSGRSTSPTGCSSPGSRRARSRACSSSRRTWRRRSRCS